MRYLIVAVTSGIVAITTLPSAVLADAPDCTQGLGGSAIECEGQSLAVTPNVEPTSAAGSRGVSGTSSGKKYVPYNRLSTGPDRQPCATTGYVEEGTTPP